MFKRIQTNTATCYLASKFSMGGTEETLRESFIKELDRDGLSVFPTHNDEWLHNKSKF